MADPRYAFEAMDWLHVDERLEKKVVHGERMSVTQYRFGPGGRFPSHVHPQEQITFCLQGAVRFIVDGQEAPIVEGELVVIPPDVPHEAEAGADGAVVLSMVSPSRAGADDSGITLLEST